MLSEENRFLLDFMFTEDISHTFINYSIFNSLLIKYVIGQES